MPREARFLRAAAANAIVARSTVAGNEVVEAGLSWNFLLLSFSEILYYYTSLVFF
jgi:hypothetical protein